MPSDDSDLLARLEAQGAEFLKLFGNIGDKRKRENNEMDVVQPSIELADDGIENEWVGFASAYRDDTDNGTVQMVNEQMVAMSRTPQVVEFFESTSKGSERKLQPRVFMSSKVSKLNQLSTVPPDQEAREGKDHEDVSNLQNDVLLHRLVHTKLLTGSLNPELNMTPAQRRTALAGRVLELTGEIKLGKGEVIIRQDEKNRAAKRIREGMIAKQKEREKKSLDEAKNAGNYHPALKKVFTQSGSGSKPRKRDRGLKIGVGRFSGGLLKLTSEEIGSVRDARSSHDRNRGRRKRR